MASSGGAMARPPAPSSPASSAFGSATSTPTTMPASAGLSDALIYSLDTLFVVCLLSSCCTSSSGLSSSKSNC